MTLSFFILTLALSTPVLKTHGSQDGENPILYDGISPSEFLKEHLEKVGVLKHSEPAGAPEPFGPLFSRYLDSIEELQNIMEEAGSELDDEARDQISEMLNDIIKDLPDENEDLEDMIKAAKEDLESEIDHASSEIDNLPGEIEDFKEMIKFVKGLHEIFEESESGIDGTEWNDAIYDFKDEVEDFEDNVNETINTSNEFAQEDQELEAKSRAKRFAIFDPLKYLQRQEETNETRFEPTKALELEKINVAETEKETRVFITLSLPEESLIKMKEDTLEIHQKLQEEADEALKAHIDAIARYDALKTELKEEVWDIKLQLEYCTDKLQETLGTLPDFARDSLVATYEDQIKVLKEAVANAERAKNEAEEKCLVPKEEVNSSTNNEIPALNAKSIF